MDPAVVTTANIAEGKSPVMYVRHEGGPGGWQFYDGGDLEGREPVVIPKEDLIELDPSLIELTDLPLNWCAWRETSEEPWQRASIDSVESQSEPTTAADDELSPEVDKFLADAGVEFDAKQEALERDWRIGEAAEWGFDQDTCLLWLGFDDGSRLEANAQILGTYSNDDQDWQWAWSNPNIEAAVARDSQAVKELGARLGLAYLQEESLPVESPGHAAYLCSIGVKATNAVGVFEGEFGPTVGFFMLKDLRWASRQI